MRLSNFVSKRILDISNVTLQMKILSSAPNFFFIFYLGHIGDSYSIAQVAMLLAAGSLLVPFLTLGRHIGIKKYYHSIGNDSQKSFISSLILFSYTTIFLMITLVVGMRSSFDFGFVTQDRTLFDIIIISSIFGALNQPLLNSLIITGYLKQIQISVYCAFLLRLFILYYFIQIIELNYLISFILSQAIFDMTFWFINLAYTFKNKLILPVFEAKYIRLTTKFSNSLTPELLLSQGLIFLERLSIKYFLSIDALSLYISLLNLFAPANMIAMSIKHGFNDNIFFQKTIREQRKVFNKEIYKIMIIIILIIFVYFLFFFLLNYNIHFVEINHFTLFIFGFFIIIRVISQILVSRIILLKNDLYIFIYTMLESPLMLSYVYLCSIISGSKEFIYFIWIIPLIKIMSFFLILNKSPEK